MNEGQLIQRRYSTTAWLCAIFFGFPFAPLLMLVGLSSPQQRQRIGTRYIVWTTVIGYLALFVILIPTSCLTGQSPPAGTIDQPYASPTATPAPFPTPDSWSTSFPTRNSSPAPRELSDHDCLRSADCFSARKATYRMQARDDCWVQIEINLANAGLTEHTRYVGGDLPTLRYFGKEPPGSDAALWLTDMEVNDGSTWERVTVECLYNHVNDYVASVQGW